MSVQRVRVELDANVRRSSNGTALLGGSPFRLVRLSKAGAELLDSWLRGRKVDAVPEAVKLKERLILAGMIHPKPEPMANTEHVVGFVVPVFDDPDGLHEALAAVRSQFAGAPVLVVDDASPEADQIAKVAASHGADLVRHRVNRGPAATRNTGWRRLVDHAEIIVFLDADVVPSEDAIAQLAGHFRNMGVAAVAPRIKARPGSTVIDGYEVDHSPLDLGAVPALVYPGTRVSYLPSTMVAVRAAALRAIDGFDESMRTGEDVDFIWRLIGDGHQVRYEPAAIAHHRNRASLVGLARQRFGYGSAAAALARRHPGKVAPLVLPKRTIAVWAVALLGGRWAKALALFGAASQGMSLARQFEGKVDQPVAESIRWSLFGQGHAARWLAQATTRAWFPLMLVKSRTRRLLALALVVPRAIEWARDRPRLDPVTSLALRAVDDASYCAGVWSGVLHERSPAALLPRVTTTRTR